MSFSHDLASCFVFIHLPPSFLFFLHLPERKLLEHQELKRVTQAQIIVELMLPTVLLDLLLELFLGKRVANEDLDV